MRRKLFVLIVCLSVQCLMAVAQDYHPLVSEGKQWKEYNETARGYRYENTYAISGDTVIDGEEYHKLYCKTTLYDYSLSETGERIMLNSAPPVYWACLQEQDGRVYIYQYDRKRALYDFTLKEGDIAFEDNEYLQRVVNVDTVLVNGVFRRRLWLSECWKSYSHIMEDEAGYWVEGVGGSRGLECPHGWFAIGGGRHLTECLEDGVSIFTEEDFTAPPYKQDGISGMRPATQTTFGLSTTFDLQGRPVTGKPRPGIYIRQGRKRVVK